MLLLAIDTAHNVCSVALAEEGQALACHTDTHPARQAEVLLPLVESLLRSAGRRYTDLGALAVNIGPGSFTGIRIGLAAARALAMATGVPLIGVPGLEMLAWQAATHPGYHPLPVLTVMDAHRGQVYLQPFASQTEPLQPPALFDIADKGWFAYVPPSPFIAIGNGVPLLAPALAQEGRNYIASPAPFPPGAGILAQCAFYRYSLPSPKNNPVQPLYLRKPDAKLPAESLK